MNRRLFLAWSPNSVHRKAISDAMAGVIDAAGGALRPVPEGSEHLTLLFLGDREVRDADLLEALSPVRRIGGFGVRLGGARVFPPSGRPRLVCLEAAQGASDLLELAESVRAPLEPLFADLAEYRLKAPHVTVARFKRGSRRRQGRAVGELLESSGVARWEGADRVERVAVVESVLSHRGPIYETVAEIELAEP